MTRLLKSICLILILPVALSYCRSEEAGVGTAKLVENIGTPGNLTVSLDIDETATGFENASAGVVLQVFEVPALETVSPALKGVAPRNTALSSGTVSFVAESPDSNQEGTNVVTLLEPGDYRVFIYLDIDGDGSAGADDKGYSRQMTIKGDTTLSLTDSNFSDALTVAVTVEDTVPMATCRPLICRWTLSGAEGDDSLEVVSQSRYEAAHFTSSGIVTNNNSAIMSGTYDVSCIMDIDGDSTKSFGDYAYEQDGVSVSEETFTIAAESFAVYTDGDELEALTTATELTYSSSVAATDITVLGDRAYLSTGTNGLEILDISDPAAVTKVNRIDPGQVDKTMVCGDYAYSIDTNTEDMYIIDISDENFLSVEGTLDVDGAVGGATVSGIYVTGDYAYLAHGASGFSSADISDKTSPAVSDTQAAGGTDTTDIFVYLGTAYLADDADGITSFDVSDPTNIGTTAIGTYDPGTTDYSTVMVTPSYLIGGSLTSGSAAADLLDYSTPASIVIDTPLAVSTSTALAAPSLFQIAGYTVMTTGENKAVIYDDDNNASIPISFASGNTANDAVVSGGYIYAATANGVSIMDVVEDE